MSARERILDRLRELALEERTLAELVKATNAKLNEELPRIQRQIDESKRELDQVSGEASALTARLARMTAAIQAIVGQLYLAVLVARLVGLHVAQGKEGQAATADEG